LLENEVGVLHSIYGERRGEYRVLVGKSGVKRPLGRPRHRWEDNIKMDFQKVENEDMDRIDLTQDGTSGGHL
jgi:hypothetical protein